MYIYTLLILFAIIFYKTRHFKGIDVVSLKSAPANIWNVQLFKELKTTLVNARQNDSKGIILTSSLRNIFSAGGDITALCTEDERKAIDFLHSFHDAWLALYSMEIPIATAINVRILLNVAECMYVYVKL